MSITVVGYRCDGVGLHNQGRVLVLVPEHNLHTLPDILS